jgi:hypothetical protein
MNSRPSPIDGELAPICLFVYDRVEETRRTVEALKANRLASRSDLFVFSDAPRYEEDSRAVAAVRHFVERIEGFGSLTISKRSTNCGLARSVIEGVTEVVGIRGSAVVLEDDLLTSAAFLDFMNQALRHYENAPRVLSVSGFSFPIRFSPGYPYDVAFGYRASSWGWATWKNRWERVDWNVGSYPSFRLNPVKRFSFNRGGSDMSSMLDHHMSGKIDSWAIRFCYHQFESNLLDVFPVRSLVENIGWGGRATNCKVDVRGYETDLWTDAPVCFRMPEEPETRRELLRQFRRFNGIRARTRRTLRRLCASLGRALGDRTSSQ